MHKKAGFTLIEIVVTMLIVGILASMAGIGILSGVRGYVFAKNNTSISEKAQLAMSRISRTFIEVLDITTVGTSPTRVTYNRLSGGANTQETLYLDTSTNSLRVAAGSNAVGGDALIDNVGSLTLTFRKGAVNWVSGADAFSLLSTVEVNLAVNRPEGGSVTFATVVSPRNNGNLGGSTAITTPPNPQTCFVATAAFGKADHPIVVLLREFRDKILFTWPGGKKVINWYYEVGPNMADAIRGKYWACTLTQLLLLPLAGAAFLILHYHVTVPLIVLSCVLALFAGLSGGRQKKFSFRQSGQNGSLLLGLIGTILVFGVLGAAMLSMTTSSTFNQISGNASTRAYYLAEAGMRYAASQFRGASTEEAKDAMLEYLHNRNYNLSSDGSFHIEIYPYYFKTTADPNGTSSLQTKFPGGVPSGVSIPASGYLKIRSESVPRQYTGRSITGSNVTFTMSASLSSYSVNSNVLPVGVAQGTAQNISNGGNLTLSSGAGFFPALNGTFTIGTAGSTSGSTTAVYVYKSRNGNVLQNVRLSQDQSQAFTVNVPANAYITSQKFVNLQSAGTFAAGTSYASTRTIYYSIPIGWVAVSGSTEKTKFTDTFEDLSHWYSGSGELGSHTIANVGGNNAMKVTGTYSPWWDIFGLYERQSIITLNWGSTGVDLNQSWSIADNLLSYDSQVKIRVRTSSNGNVDYYMPGIIFRIDESGQMYGVSLLRANQGGIIDRDRVPDELCPDDTSGDPVTAPMIVLWQEAPADTVRWLAYKTLSSSDHIIESGNKQIKDWSTLVVRVIEADSLQFDTGGPGSTGPILYGDTVTGALSGATAVVNGTPILTLGNWSSHDAAGWLTVTNVTKNAGVIQFQAGENLMVNGVVRARYTGTSRQKDNYIRVYYADTAAHGTLNADALNNQRKASVRGTELNWPKDNISEWASNDGFTLVQWDSNLNTGAGGGLVRLGTGSELNAIIRTNTLVTPSSGNFTRPEIGLDTWGSSSTNVYFDDFGLQAPAPGQTQGFLPGIQQ